VTFELVLSRGAEEFLASIAPFEREQLFRGLTLLALDPFPDGRTKIALPFPHRPGTLGTSFGQFWIAYTLQGHERLVVLTIYWSLDSGRNPGASLL